MYKIRNDKTTMSLRTRHRRCTGSGKLLGERALYLLSIERDIKTKLDKRSDICRLDSLIAWAVLNSRR